MFAIRRVHQRWFGPIVACLLFTVGTAQAEKLAVELQENIEYGKGGDQTLTLHLAKPVDATEPLPGLIFIHGGGWQAGSKDIYRKAIQDFAAEGYVAATVTYRLAPKHLFPAQIEDCKCAVRWMRAHADELGVDPTRIGAIGGSAGAHLSMLLGTMDSSDGCEGEGGWADESSKVQAVVSYFGPVDLTETEIGDLPSRQLLNEGVIRGIIRAFVGGEPSEKIDLLRQASPLHYVNAGDAPILMFQGTRDILVPYDHPYEMAHVLTEHNIKGRVELILGAGHGWAGPEMARTQQASIDFFNEHLKAEEKK